MQADHAETFAMLVAAMGADCYAPALARIVALREYVSRLADWQPISTAPMNTPILVGPSKGMGICVAIQTEEGGWQVETRNEYRSIYPPSVWKPLGPDPEN